MTDEATQTGVSEEQLPDDPQTEIDEEAERLAKNPRAQAMQDMVEQQREERESESADLIPGHQDTDTPPEEAVATAEEVVEDKPEATNKEIVDALPTEVKDGKTYVKLKVDGKEELLSSDQAVAALQKYRAADARLGRAADTMRQAEEYNALLQKRAADIEARERALAERPKPQATPELGELSKKLTDAIYSGEEEQVAAAFQEVLAQRTPSATAPTVTPEQINALVQRSIAQSQQQARFEQAEQAASTAQNVFNSEYEDISGDEDKRMLWERKVLDRVKANREIGTEKPILEVMREAGEEVRGKFSPATTNRLQRGKPALPTGSGATASQPPPKQDKPKTTDDVLTAMKRARGQFV